MAQLFIEEHFDSLKPILEDITKEFFNKLTEKVDVTYSIKFNKADLYPHRDSLNLRLKINNVEFLQQYLIWRRLVLHILMKFKNLIAKQYSNISFHEFRRYLHIIMCVN